MLYSSRIEFQKWTTVHLHSGITFTFVTLVYSAGSKSVYSLKLHGGKKIAFLQRSDLFGSSY